MGRNERRGQPGAGGSQASSGTPSPRTLADEAETLQQQGERRKGLEAASKFEAAAAKYQAALEGVVQQRQQLGLALGPPDGAAAQAAAPGGRRGGGGGPVTLADAIDMRSGLAECYQLLGEALLAAAEARPDSELSGEEERRAACAAIRQYATAAGHYTCCHQAAVLTTPAPGAAEVAAAAAAGGLDAAASNAFAAASAVAAAASAAAGFLGADVAVNAGNSLAALGEQLEEEATAAVSSSSSSSSSSGSGTASGGPVSLRWLAQYDVALKCFRAAAACYRSAEAQEEDALTLSNLADVLIQTGTCLHAVAKAVREAPPELAAAALAAAGGGVAVSVGDWAAAREAEASADFTAALAAYESACSHTDSSQGDDLPGLLCNWGAGLLGMAACLQDPAARLPLLQQAAGRLEHAASFDRADPAPWCSLGDVLAAAGEAAEALSRAAAAAAGPSGCADAAAAAAAVAAAGAGGVGGPAAAAAHWRCVAVGHMTAALDRGYGAALRLRADEPEALVGAGEVHLALARLAALELSAAAAAGSPDGSAAAEEARRRHVEAAAGALSTAVSRPERLGGWRQRCDVRYNLACALALAGRDQEAASLFRALLRCGALRAAELSEDPDLAPLRNGAPGAGGQAAGAGQGVAWFVALLQEAAALAAGGATAAGHL